MHGASGRDGEHGAGSRLDHVLCDRTEHPADDARPAVGAQDDEVVTMVLGLMDDVLPRDSRGEAHVDALGGAMFHIE